MAELSLVTSFSDEPDIYFQLHPLKTYISGQNAMEVNAKNCFKFITDEPNLVTGITSYRWSPVKTALFFVVSLLTCGLWPLMLLIWKRGKSGIIKRTHSRCSLNRASIFLATTPSATKPIICYPVVATQVTVNDAEGLITLEPVNRRWLTFWRRIFSTLSTDRFIEFITEEDSASAFRVHSGAGDAMQSAVEVGSQGIFRWNNEKRLFQRMAIDKHGHDKPLPIIDCFSEDEPPDYVMSPTSEYNALQQELAVNDDKFVLEIYRKNRWKTGLWCLLSALSGGAISAVFVWKPTWRLWAMFDKLNLEDSHKATHVKIADAGIDENVWIKPLWLSTRKGVLLHDNGGLLKSKCLPWQFIWRFFVFESMPFVLDVKTNRFIAGPVLYEEQISSQQSSENRDVAEGKGHAWSRRALCGFNVTPVPLTPVWLIFWREAFSPLYIFQVACCVMWFQVEYTIYASCLLIFAFFTISWSVYMTYTNERAVWHAVVGQTEADEGESQKVLIAEQGDTESGFTTAIKANMLVPGDVVFLSKTPEGKLPRIPADLVLLDGSCLVDESMLSGEVTPVTKFPCSNIQREKPLERNMLHSGTKLVCISSGAATAMVTSIGFSTTRGRLVRSVLRPSKADVRFTVETIKFLCAMALVGIAGLTYSVIIRILRDEDPVMILIMCGVLAAVVVPPQLSVGLTISLVVAQVRLKARSIFCTNPKSVTPTGSVDLICFDKTGTLTEESVRLKSVLSIAYRKKTQNDVDSEGEEASEEPYYSATPSETFLLCAASCNTVTLLATSQTPSSSTVALSESATSDPIGDPLDLELLNFSHFKLLPSGVFYSTKTPTLKIEIMKNFGFSPERRSACVIAKVRDGATEKEDIYVFVKGAPEHIIPRCVAESIPGETSGIMTEATYTGLRLILLGAKKFDEKDWQKQLLGEEVNQDTIESELELCGISFFENTVKPESPPTIAKLHAAQLRSLIITGDDVRTAVATARECGIVGNQVLMVQESPSGSETASVISATTFMKMCALMNFSELGDNSLIAITEDSWRILRYESYINKSIVANAALKILLQQGAVFARFRPEQKAEVVAEFKNRFGFIVAMVGDGANDCCALKTADVGIALTEAEASVASAFTCKNRNISPVLDILKEGRGSLVSTFGLFSVMVSYSCVQFSSMCILYWIQSNFADLQFLYLDLFLLTTLSLVFPLVPAFHAALSEKRPHKRLLCFGQVAPILVHNAVNLAFQFFVFHYVQYQSWYLPYNIPQDQNVNREYNSFESYSVFGLSINQYIWSALVFSKGAPFRSRFYRSRLFTAHIIALLIANHSIVLYLPEVIRQILQVFPAPSLHYRIMIILLSYINLCCSFICVRFVEEIAQAGSFKDFLAQCCRCKCQPPTSQRSDKRRDTEVDAETELMV